MTEPALVVSDAPEAMRYEARVGNRLAGVAEYIRTGQVIEFLHIAVVPGFEGRGVAGAIVRASLDRARAEGLAVVPTCPFYAAWIAQHPEYQDLLGRP